MTLKFKDPERSPVVRPNILLYGAPKTAKSTSASTIPGGIAYLNFDLDNALHFARLHDSYGRIMEIDLTDGVRDTLEELKVEAKKDEPVMDAVVIDPVGDMHRTLLEIESRNAVRPSRDAYGDVATEVERFCRAMCKAPNVACVIVAHDNPVKDELSGEMVRMPWTGTSNPALGRKLLGMVDIVAYTGVVLPKTDEGEGMPEYWAQLISANGRIGGDRFGVLGKKRLLGRTLPDGSMDPEVKGLTEWVEVINGAAAAKVAAKNDTATKAAGKGK